MKSYALVYLLAGSQMDFDKYMTWNSKIYGIGRNAEIESALKIHTYYTKIKKLLILDGKTVQGCNEHKNASTRSLADPY